MNIYEELGMNRVVNASGRMTYLGVSTISNKVADAAKDAAQNYVVINDLIDKAGELISKHTGGEDSCPTCSASAGIAISIAGLITKGKRHLVLKMPVSDDMANEVIIQKGHAVNYGAPITTMIRLGGGVPVEVGMANKVEYDDVEGSITQKTVCLFYCKSHHCVQKGMLSLEKMIEIAHKHELPIVIDAAAEEDMRKYLDMGVDLVIYSGAKALEATTSGFITGNRILIGYCKKQYEGIGRAMKVGKEQIVGLIAAMDQYDELDHDAIAENNHETVERMCKSINSIEYCHATIMQDEAGRKIYRCRITFDSKCGKTAEQISEELINGIPAIYCRPNQLNIGVMMLDPRPMVDGDEQLIIKRLKEIMEGK